MSAQAAPAVSRDPSRAAATARAAGWLTGAQASSLVLGFVLWAYAARALSTREFGAVQLGIAVGTYLALSCTVGLAPLSVSEFARQTRPRAYVLQFQSIRVVHAALILAALAGVALLRPDAVPAVVAISAGSVVLRQLWPEWADIALDASRRVTLVRTAYFVVALPATIFLVTKANDGVALGLVLALAAIVVAMPAWGLTLLNLRKLPQSPPAIRTAPFSAWLRRWPVTMRRALPLGAGDVLGQLLANADILMLGLLASREAVALYGAAYRIIFAVQGAGVALRYSSLRTLAAPKRPGEDRVKFEHDLLLMTLWGSTLIASLIALASHPIVLLAYSSKYAGSVDLLRVLVWTWPLDFASAIALNLVIVQGRRSRYVIAMTVAAVGNLGANAIVIPRYGAQGAAVVIVASLALLLVLALRLRRPNDLGNRGRSYRAGALLLGVGLCGSLVADRLSTIGGLGLLAIAAGGAAYQLYRVFALPLLRRRLLSRGGAGASA